MTANRTEQGGELRGAGVVLFVVASLRGGAGTHALMLARELRRIGWRVLLAAPNDSPANAARAHGTFDAWDQLPLDDSPWFGQVGPLGEIIRRHRPDIVHAHGIRAAFPVRTWALFRRFSLREKGKRPGLVYTIHGLHPEFAPDSFRKWAGLSAERTLDRAVDRIIVVSPSDRDLVTSRKLAPLKKVVLIPNAIDPAPFRNTATRDEARAALNLSPDTFAVGALSRLHRQKAVHLLAEAADRLQHKIPHLVVLIGGDGPLRRELEERTKEVRLRDSVRFLGEVSDPAAFYRALDAFCLTSLWEGMPLVVLEAAATRLPIVATKVPGTVDILRHEKDAILVPPNDSAALAEALIRYHRDPVFAWKLAAEATRSLERFFHPDDMCRAVADVYSQVAGLAPVQA